MKKTLFRLHDADGNEMPGVRAVAHHQHTPYETVLIGVSQSRADGDLKIDRDNRTPDGTRRYTLDTNAVIASVNYCRTCGARWTPDGQQAEK